MASAFGGGLHTNSHRTGRGSFLGNRSTILWRPRWALHGGADGIPVSSPTTLAVGCRQVLIVVFVDCSTRAEDFEQGSRVHVFDQVREPKGTNYVLKENR